MSRYRYDADKVRECPHDDVSSFSYRAGHNVTETTVRCSKCKRLIERLRFTAHSSE